MQLSVYGPWRDLEVWLHLFWTLALERGGWSASRPGRLIPAENPPVPGWAPQPVWTFLRRNALPLAGLEPRTVRQCAYCTGRELLCDVMSRGCAAWSSVVLGSWQLPNCQQRLLCYVITTAGHLPLSWASLVQSPHSLSISLMPISISSRLHLCLPNGLFPSHFAAEEIMFCVTPIRAACSAHLILFDLITPIISGEQCRS